jgi:hypothetical protein
VLAEASDDGTASVRVVGCRLRVARQGHALAVDAGDDLKPSVECRHLGGGVAAHCRRRSDGEGKVSEIR